MSMFLVPAEANEYQTVLRGRYLATIAKVFVRIYVEVDSMTKGGIRDSCHLIVKQ
jgi:hypothetical protein